MRASVVSEYVGGVSLGKGRWKMLSRLLSVLVVYPEPCKYRLLSISMGYMFPCKPNLLSSHLTTVCSLSGKNGSGQKVCLRQGESPSSRAPPSSSLSVITCASLHGRDHGSGGWRDIMSPIWELVTQDRLP